MNKINVEGYPNLERDYETGAILNNDSTEYEKYIKMKSIRESEQVKLDTAINDISELKSDIAELKQMIFKLVEKNG